LDRKHKKDYLTSRQVKVVLNNIDRSSVRGIRDYAMLVLMITGDLRTIEVSRANIGDLRIFNALTLYNGKSKKPNFPTGQLNNRHPRQ
jgi:integrase/recombinase XerD